MKELVKTWRKDGFTLRVWDLNKRDSLGKWMLGYQLKDGRKVIFEGEDFACSPLHAVDSLATVKSILGFLSLRPGDIDREYFANYTPEQMEWCLSGRAEYLGSLCYD